MKKNIVFLLMLVLIGGMLVGFPIVFAGDGEALFNSKCGQCHGRSGEAPAFSPVKFASSQWQRFFERDKHKRWKDTSGIISAGEAASIKQYLVDHAADSDLPIAAGLR